MMATQPGVAMSQVVSAYLSYLLRLWSTKVDGDMVWRASLESGLTSQRQPFASLDELFGFLRRQTGVWSDQTRVKSDEVSHGAPWVDCEMRGALL
jgi:hypothetical protein